MFDWVSNPDMWTALVKIAVINVVLSGDNAVVIALACRNLPPAQQRKAFIVGTGGIVVLMTALTAFAALLMSLPWIQAIGSLLLLWIGVKLLTEEEEEGEGKIKAHGTLLAAVGTITVANTVMSLDNAIAMAAAAHGDMTMITIGLVLSVPVIMLGASVIASVLDRFPWVAMVGAALIGWIAGGVIADDGRTEVADGAGHLVEKVDPGSTAAWLDKTIPQAELVCSIVGVFVVLAVGLTIARRNKLRAERDATPS